MNPGRDDLSTNVAAFCGVLRAQYGFRIGSGEAHDCLRALDVIGITDRDRVRSAFRLICCTTHAQTLAFDPAFDAFFLASRPGIAQPALAARKAKPGPPKPGSPENRDPTGTPQPSMPESDRGAAIAAAARRTSDDNHPDADAWQLLRARYSALAARGSPLRIDPAAAQRMRRVAQQVVRSVSLGRSRRWKAQERGRRFDIRRTIRSSLETGGDPVALHFLGHPLRNPRFVVVIDGSRSMSEHTGLIVEFTAALCAQSARAHGFFFSTRLLDVTAKLRAAFEAGEDLSELGEAWGGGTKIGDNLHTFVAKYGARLLSPETVIIVFSDGLDVGDVPQLERSLREIDRRSAGIVWLNPHAANPGYVPTARGMRTALPFIALLSAADDEIGFERLARRIAQTPRIRGRRG